MTEEIEARAVLSSRELQRKFEDLRDHLEEEVPDSVSDKSGNSAVTRMAIRMAHDKMSELKEEKREKTIDFQRVENRIKEYAENI